MTRPALVYGTLTLGPLQKGYSPRFGADLLAFAYDLGVTLCDTAELYQTYPHIKEALKLRPQLRVCTKSYCYDKATAKASLDKAMREIGRDYIDIFLLHEQESEHTLRGHMEALCYLHECKSRGDIGQVGLSTHYVAGVMAGLREPKIEVLFPIVNMRGLGVADGTALDMERAIECAKGANKRVMAMKPLGGGHLIEHRQAAFEYLFGLDGISEIAVGMYSREEILYNVKLFNGESIDGALERGTLSVPRKLIIDSYCIACGRCVQKCPQGALCITDAKAAVNQSKCVFCGYCASVCPEFCIKVI